MLRYKIAPKCLLPGPFGHSDVGGNPGVAGTVRSYNLVFTYPCQRWTGVRQTAPQAESSRPGGGAAAFPGGSVSFRLCDGQLPVMANLRVIGVEADEALCMSGEVT